MLEFEIINDYSKVAMNLLKRSFPHLSENMLQKGLQYSINKRFKNHDISLNNNYKKVELDTTLADMYDYISKREPIITHHGAMFKKHAQEDNPISKVIQKYLASRKINKKIMLTECVRGSEEYEKYNLFQLLDKLDANGTYGILGMCTCPIYNVYVASATTTQGVALVSSAGLQFEMFLSNNVKFGSLNELVSFVNNVLSERDSRKFRDDDLITKNATMDEVFTKLIGTCGFNYIPDEDDMSIVWSILNTLDQEDLNRLFYKNNLYLFIENDAMQTALLYLISNMNEPFTDPNEAPESICYELDEFCDILMEYVYYGYQIIDKTDKYANMYRNICIITDTDSAIVSLDGWFRYVSNIIENIDIPLKHVEVELEEGYKAKETTIDEFIDEYAFLSDEILKVKKDTNPNKVSSNEGLRYSIINIMAYCLSKVIQDYMINFTKNSNSYAEDRDCKIVMKNEFLFKRVIISGKRNYATLQELQEGNIVPLEDQLDVKGMPMDKTVNTDETRSRLKSILYDTILNSDELNQIEVLKALGKFEKEIFLDIQSGSKKYYKPVTIKSVNSYSNPMGIQGIKASVVYNALRDENSLPINLDEQSSVNIIKININKKNVKSIYDNHREHYDKVMELLNQKHFTKDGITSIAVPSDDLLPAWILEFVDYTKIITSNIGSFPVESIGIFKGRASNSYTNILKI